MNTILIFPLWLDSPWSLLLAFCLKLSGDGGDLHMVFCYYRPQRSCGQGNVFTRVCDSVHRGGLQAGRTPPPDQADPPGPGRPPWTRENPPAPGRPPTHQGEPPPRPGRPPKEADSRIRSMSGWYASYWNAFLFYECSSVMGIPRGGEDTQTLPYAKEFVWTFCVHRWHWW